MFFVGFAVFAYLKGILGGIGWIIFCFLLYRTVDKTGDELSNLISSTNAKTHPNLSKASAAIQSGDYETAAAILQSTLSEQPNDRVMRWKLAEVCWEQLRDAARSLEHYKVLAASGTIKDQFRATQRSVEILVSTNQQQKAKSLLSFFGQKYPGTPEADLARTRAKNITKENNQ